MTRLLVGVDAGGTRTRVLLVDPHAGEVGRGEGAPGSVDPQDPEVSARVLAESVRQVAEAAEAELPAAALWAGVAGAGRETTRAALEDALRAQGLAERVEVGTDAEAALKAAAPDGPGLLLLAGTGSIALARLADGRLLRAGGWGSALGDEGSGYHLALEGLRSVLRAHDGRGPSTGLTGELLEVLELPDPSALVPWFARAERWAVAGLAPRVVEVAQRGDGVARSLVDQAVEALLAHVETLSRRMDPGTPVALAGGMLDPGSGPLREPVRAELEARGYTVSESRVEPATGAVALARELIRAADS